jgi:hypothetical protein
MMWQVHIYDQNNKISFTTHTDWTGPQDGEFDNYTNVAGVWQNISIVHVSGTLDYLYVDGQQIESHTALTFDSDTTSAVTIGASPQGGNASVVFDELRISNTARSPAWMKATYHSLFNELITFSTDPIADAEGYVMVGDVLTSGIVVRLYRRADGSLVGEDITTVSGTFTIPTIYDEYHYALALYTTSGTNALIYDWLHPTLNP